MQKSARSVGIGPEYRERLGPSLWVLVSAALAGPMAGLVLAPLDTTLALVVGGVVALAVIALLVAASPVVDLRDGTLCAGRARIGVEHLGDPVAFTGDPARHARGPGLDPRSWHVIRGGIDGIAVIPVIDRDDPTPVWVISSRTPDRLVAALRQAQSAGRAQATPRTPGR